MKVHFPVLTLNQFPVCSQLIKLYSILQFTIHFNLHHEIRVFNKYLLDTNSDGDHWSDTVSNGRGGATLERMIKEGLQAKI